MPFYNDDIVFCFYFLEDALRVLSTVNFCRLFCLRCGSVPGFVFKDKQLKVVIVTQRSEFKTCIVSLETVV